MAHYAFLNQNNIVTEVIVGIDENELIEGLFPEVWYGQFRKQKCKQTSYNTFGGKHRLGGVPFRKNFAGIGYFYDEENDAFIPPKPYQSWKLSYETYLWEAPVPYPNNDKAYIWNEVDQKWDELVVN